ncbi:unnamed protein product [Staurois parvus]|uniref:Uncharacterized protein n=1 Tax=Staurois parvus TaxID=386267 RepID=A0ABN9H9H8_9NEOB|nr:unnamed protein product [Staurois parvus]
MGSPGNRKSGAPVSSPTLKPHKPKKAYERYQGHLMGPPTDPEQLNGQAADRGQQWECTRGQWWSVGRGGLTTHGAPGNRGSWSPCVLAQNQKSL